MFKAVLFDFDYTLGNSEEGIILSSNYALTQMGYPEAERDAIRRTIGLTLPHSYTVLTGDENAERAQEFMRLFMLRADDVMTANTVLYDGVLDMLRAIKERGLAIGIVTTKYAYRIEAIFDKYHARDLLDLIIGGDSVKAKKPDPEGVLYALNALQLQKHEVLYVGDSVVDAKTAEAAAVPFCAVLTGTTPAEDFAPYGALCVAPTAVEGCEQLLFAQATAPDGCPFVQTQPITKGWSCDQKFMATAKDGTRYLLRITPFEKSESRENMFRMQRTAAALDIPMCRPVKYGCCAQGVYVLQSWIDGEDARDVIPQLSTAEQYAYGLAAGQILQKIHAIPAPDDQPDWEERFNAKIDRKIARYGECPLKYPNDKPILDYIAANRHLLRGRVQCFQHGDYHIGNMMIDCDGALQIIDFDRYDFGDPWEEFNRIVWDAQEAPVFATGRVDGYFDGNVPAEFWSLLALYIASNTLSSLPWAIPFGQREIDTMCRQAEEMLTWYDDMKQTVPTWYTEAKKQLEKEG